MPLVHRRLLLQLGPITLGLAIANGSAAAEWTTSAGVAPGVTYTDNVCLSADNEKGEWIAEVTPDVAVQADGRRANLDLAGSVNVNSLSDSKLEDLDCNAQGFGGNRKQFAPRLRGRADAELVEDWLYVDGNARIEQNEASPFIKGGGDRLDTTGNTNTLYNYSVSPYIERRIKDEALFDLRYTWDQQYNTENVVGDSSQQSWQSRFGNVPGTSALSWGLQGDYSKVEYDNQRNVQNNTQNKDSELKSAQVNLGYQLSRVWQVNGYYGEEWNDFVSRNDDIDGSFWDAGVRWTPNARTTVDAGTGHRFFGNAPRFSIDHRHKRNVLRASYAKTLTYDRNIRAGANDPFPGDGGELPPVNVEDSSTLSNSPILDERFTLGYAYQGLRSRLGLEASHSDQTREDNGGDSTFKRASLSLSRSMSRQLTIAGRLSWTEQEPKSLSDISNFVNATETWRFILDGTRQLNQDVSLALQYRYTDQQADNELNQYKENRVTLTLRFEL
jgi:hypothetical protein